MALVLCSVHKINFFMIHLLCMTCLHSGDNESGKTTLVSKLQGAEDQKKGSALEYMYVTVKDEYGDGLCIMLCYICKFVCIL